MCNLVKDHTTIREMDLSGNNFKDKDAEHFHTMLVVRLTLPMLLSYSKSYQNNIDWCFVLSYRVRFTQTHTECSCFSFQSNSSLKQLVLRHNHFEFEGAKWFRDALMDNEHLRILDLSWNHFRLKGAVLIAEMVKENYGLKYLNLMMNGIGDDGAAAMGAALRTNQCLVELNIMANRISEAGAISVAKGLLVNDVLETLRVRHKTVRFRDKCVNCNRWSLDKEHVSL